MPPRTVIGVDCATVAKEVGPARARGVNGRWRLLEAALCVAAGLDFLAGDAAGPADTETARREGWIWVRG